MSDINALYSEVKPDIYALTDALFELSETFLRKRGNFLPHGAVLTEHGEVKLIAAAPDSGSDLTNSTEILPVLHDGLRIEAKNIPLKAIGVAENVTITREGQRATMAIKVLVEHKRGLTVAIYLPFEKKLLKGYVFGDAFSAAANPEVSAWGQSAA